MPVICAVSSSTCCVLASWRARKTCSYRAMEVLSSCWRIARRQALKRPSERTLGLSSEGGNTGRRADWPCHTKITNDLLRPSVQLPAGVCGWARYTDFGWLGKVAGGGFGADGPDAGGWNHRGPPYRLDLFVCMSYK